MDSWSTFWIVSGLGLWTYGFVTVGRPRETGFLVDKSFVRPPFFIYLICGMPKAKNIPVGVMSIPALIGQLAGWLWLIVGLTYFFTQSIALHVWLFFIGTILIIIYALVLFNRNLYKNK